MQKWHRFGKYIFYSARLVEATFLGLQLTLAFRLKAAPLERHTGLAVATGALAVACTVYELWVVTLWWRNEADTSSTSSNFLRKVL